MISLGWAFLLCYFALIAGWMMGAAWERMRQDEDCEGGVE